MKPNPDAQRSPYHSMLIRTSSLWSLLSLLFLSACGDTPTSATKPEPISATTVEAWLAVMDQGDYAKSWELAGEGFRKQVTKVNWVAMSQQVRQPLGSLISRKVKSTQQTDKLPEMSRGSYFVAVFDTSFAELAAATETVIFAKEKNDQWKAAGYLITPRNSDDAVTSLLEPIRQKHSVPAIAAAVVTSDGIQFVGVVGVRKRGTDIAATLDDRWHLGSDTKAMTSTLIAKLVERGQLKWDTTMAEVFPDLAPKMHADFQKVTVTQLLSHYAGLPPNLTLSRYVGDDVVALRLRAVREELAKKPQSTPGTSYKYSNLGYIIVGAVVEKVTGKTWEQLMTSEIFEPLKMKSVGFGGTGTPGQIDQPWPHTADGKPTAQNGPAMDNLPVMGPAGRVHCTIQDWAKFIQDQLRGARGEAALLKPEAYQTLHTATFGGDYALGWSVAERSWGGGKVLNHAGDNTMNFANAWIAPKRDFAIIACVNQSGKAAFTVTDEVIVALMNLINEKQRKE
ncbi:MAG TPA: serine hydrolase [Verrucomicrobiae bacterium]|nr:serine hydrolase [Verrucomicrobiae bacterium]